LFEDAFEPKQIKIREYAKKEGASEVKMEKQSHRNSFIFLDE